MKQEMMGWQWHQLDHMQLICTSLQTDNHIRRYTSPANFYRPDRPTLPAAQPTASIITLIMLHAGISHVTLDHPFLDHLIGELNSRVVSSLIRVLTQKQWTDIKAISIPLSLT